MIQHIAIQFKIFCEKNRDLIALRPDDVLGMLDDLTGSVISEAEAGDSHHTYLSGSGKTKCSSRSLKPYSAYSRNLVMYDSETGEAAAANVTIPVFLCRTCRHYHALLPFLVFIPYLSYSVQFVLHVLIDRYDRHMKVEDILKKYSLPRSTYYRLLERAEYYRRCWRRAASSYDHELFSFARTHAADALRRIFIHEGMALCEENRRLAHCRSRE